jgi:hypothetical protein
VLAVLIAKNTAKPASLNDITADIHALFVKSGIME